MAEATRILDIDILHVTAGDTTLSFDINNAEDVEKANNQITDMLRLGYAIFIEVDGKTSRVTEFSATQGVYKINGKEVKADKIAATAVAPTAGGCPTESPL